MKNIEAVGMMTWLMGQSEQHCNWTVDDIHRLILPPVALQQFRIWQVEHQPVGFVTWGLFNEEIEQGYVKRTRKLQPDDWNAGDRLWVVDFIAPWGGVGQMVREGREHLRSVLGKGIECRGFRSRKGKQCFGLT